jgi:predicted branched-subunit amino acid permease
VTGSPTEPRYRDGARAIAPIVVAAAAFSATFGVLARDAGIETPAALTMSATTFAGSAQFAVASVFDAGGGIAAAIAAAVFLNARYAPISLTVAPAFSGGRLRRLLESQLIVDESWAVSRGSDGSYERRLLVGAGLVLYVAWVGGTAIGSAAGDALGNPERFGLDAAFPALFLALLVPQVRTRRAVTAALAGGALALALVPFAPAGVPIVAASAVCLLGWNRS